ncbi:LysR family transcriptional regulator [Aestuariivirga litoralis]|uniref:LysR family transcriptional regulator n=2 Tax=Aestuariivirga litoralis TaxID=2650924 RepID=A0A2W2B7Q6_9HYPH|nr:LysR family transcriptional regulator [Aestuariivirga litoralis]
MTQSAVSYQIKQIEAFVGAPLFLREARGVRLNARGEQLAPMVQAALASLSRAFRAVSDKAHSVLTISTMQTIAGNWLAPRIGSFQMLHPEFAVRLDISSTLADFAVDGIDVAIRSGRGHWPGLEQHLLFEQTFTAVASPAYLARAGRPKTPEDMLSHVLIAPSDEWWDIWFRAAGVATPITFTRPGIDVETQQMAASVALAGHGIAIITPRFEAQSFETGRLVALFDVTASSGESYYLAYPREHRASRKIRLFRDWVLKEAASD